MSRKMPPQFCALLFGRPSVADVSRVNRFPCIKTRDLASRPRPSPLTRVTRNQQKDHFVTPDQKRKDAEYKANWKDGQGAEGIMKWVDAEMVQSASGVEAICSAAGVSKSDLDYEVVARFLWWFDNELQEAFDKGRNMFDLKRFYDVNFLVALSIYELPIDRVYSVARNMYIGHSRFRNVGYALLVCLSRHGHAEATITFFLRTLRLARGGQSQLNSKKSLNAMNSPEGREALRKIDNLAKDGNCRAMTLLGLLALHQGNTRTALTHFQEAIPGAVELANKKPDDSGYPLLALQQSDELSSPWLDLAALTWHTDRDVALNAFKIGAEMDDPNVFFMKATLGRQELAGTLAVERGVSIQEQMELTPYTLEWLHDMSKAAAAGHIQGALEMANYYADAPAQQSSDSSDVYDSLRSMPSNVSDSVINPEANLAYYAAVAQTPQERLQMAEYWLDICEQYRYVPAMEARARLHINRFAYPALNLKLAVAHPDDQRAGDHAEEHPEFAKFGDGIPNPMYNPAQTHKCLLNILLMETDYEAAQSGTREDLVRWNEQWQRYSGVADSYESRIPELGRKARHIADIVGIDIRYGDEPDKVLYMHQGKRGRGIDELGA